MGKSYKSSLVWLGTWETPGGLLLNGFHLWDKTGHWQGVYKTCARANVEASSLNR